MTTTRTIQKSARAAISAACAFFMFAVTANAGGLSPQVVSVANAKTVTYSLAAGGTSSPITVPADVPVHLIGVQTASGFRG
jgi:hypothetical protein